MTLPLSGNIIRFSDLATEFGLPLTSVGARELRRDFVRPINALGGSFTSDASIIPMEETDTEYRETPYDNTVSYPAWQASQFYRLTPNELTIPMSTVSIVPGRYINGSKVCWGFNSTSGNTVIGALGTCEGSTSKALIGSANGYNLYLTSYLFDGSGTSAFYSTGGGNGLHLCIENIRYTNSNPALSGGQNITYALTKGDFEESTYYYRGRALINFFAGAGINTFQSPQSADVYVTYVTTSGYPTPRRYYESSPTQPFTLTFMFKNTLS